MKNPILTLLFALILNVGQAQKIYESALLIDAKSALGEGSIWHAGENKLYWIDIDQKILHTYDPANKKENHYDIGQKAGTIVPIDTGGVLLALKSGVYSFNLITNTFRLITSPEKDMPENRFNDGKCDPAGRFWVGSMGPRYKASLYRIDDSGECTKMLDSISTSNGIVWSVDLSKMYYIDTPTGKVMQYDYNNQTGNITNPKVVIKFPDGVGYPDGMTIDSEGMLWIAHWGGKCVGRWNPGNGKMIGKVEIPAPNVTSCAFGGKNLETLFITTATSGMDETNRKAYPLSGGVFMATPGVCGIQANYFKTKR